MQPYTNPNYFSQNLYPNFNSQMPIQNPYMDRMNQAQQYQPNFQMSVPQQQMQVGLNGRIVDDFSVLNANDVPMDGSGAVFIKRDASEIQWRNWAANGTIVTTSYKPISEKNNQDSTNMPQTDLNTLYEDVKALRGEITERFDRLENSINAPTAKTNGRAKKEADSE